jgi:hypothetical protein
MSNEFDGKLVQLSGIQGQGGSEGLELRCEPRFEVNLPALTRLRCAPGDGETPEAYTETACLQNLSQSGIQLRCSPALVAALMPREAQGQERLRRAPAELEIYFDLPKGEGVQPVSLTCTLVYLRRVKGDRYLLGCNLCGFSKRSGPHIEAYLRSLSDGG